MADRMPTKKNTTEQPRKCASWYVATLFVFSAMGSGYVSANTTWQGAFGTLGIHFNVPAGQPSTTINSSSSTLWCNSSCTNPIQASVTSNGTGFSVGPGNYTYVCTRNGSQCFPAGNLQTVCGGTGSIKIVNNYANGHTFTTQCLPVTISSNTMVMITPSTQTMCTTTMAGSCT